MKSRHPLKYPLLGVLAALIALPLMAGAEPESLHPDVTLERLFGAGSNPVRLVKDPVDHSLYLLKTNGEINLVDVVDGSMQRLYRSTNHTLRNAQGLAVGADGTMYLSGYSTSGNTQTAKIMRGVIDASGERSWSPLATTEPFEQSDSWYNHRVNDVAISPDGRFLFVNSGSRTEHGEVQDNNGAFPGLRETGLTAIMLRIPIDADDITLPNDREALRAGGYLFAEGLRNSFSVAFAPNGDLFATENGPNRDMPEELNWVREGHHYGFPWRMGREDTPQQFPGYDPASDPLLPPSQRNAGNGLYADDPDYPPPPMDFTDPVLNVGPDADRYRDLETGQIRDASDDGVALATFTTHRSPLGLVFDNDNALGGEFQGAGFVLAWNGGNNDLISPFGDPGQDLCLLKLTRDGDGYTTTVTQVVVGFTNPIDAELIGNTMYVVEHGGTRGVFRIDFPAAMTAVLGEESLPSTFSLGQNHPNPFNSSTTIRFELTEPSTVELVVYDLTGQRVSTLVSGFRQAGSHSFTWNGLNDGGFPVASGTYMYELSTPDGRQLRKMLLLQ